LNPPPFIYRGDTHVEVQASTALIASSRRLLERTEPMIRHLVPRSFPARQDAPKGARFDTFRRLWR